MLTVTYDSNLDGISQAGVVPGAPIDAPVLVAGKADNALKSGPVTGYVEYQTQGVVSPVGGAVEMWVCPLDWKPDDKEFHVFFEASGEGALYLYKYWESPSLLMLTRDDNSTQERNRYSSVSIGEWKPGEWHFVAGTWSQEGVVCYVDDKRADLPTEGWLPKTLGATFRVGDHPWQIPRTSTSLIDEVRIFDRPLSAAHIAAHYAGDYTFTVPLTREACRFQCAFFPGTSEVRVLLSTGGADVEDARLGARFAVVPKGNAVPGTGATLPFAAGCVIRSVPFASPQPGEYDVVAEVLLDAIPAFELRRSLTIPTLEWRGNSLGMEDKVLPPWTPLKQRAKAGHPGHRRIQCWGREYAFEGTALPAQITSRREKLLSGPMSLAIQSGGQEVKLVTQSLHVLSSSDTRVELAGAVIGKAQGQSIRLKTRIVAEYDGVVLIEISCGTPDTLALVESLSVDIPLKKDRALYLHRWLPNSWPGYAGRVPPGIGVVDRAKFIPYAWLGDNDRGLFWFCESDEHWPNSDSEDAIEIVRTSGEVRLRLNLLAEGQTLPADWRFVFGLQATPVKPLPENWRRWRLSPAASGANVAVIWPAPTPDSFKYFGYPEAMDAAAFSGRVGNLHAGGAKAVPYLCLVALSEACPEWPYFREAAMGPDFATSADVAAYHAAFKVVSPLAEGFADFIVWKNNQFIINSGIDGSYHDLTEPWGSTTLEGGCGYIRDGKRRPTYPILGFRELYRRMYAVMKALPGESFTVAHMSGNVAIPILAYEDSRLDGEQFINRVTDSYLDILSLDAFRAEFMGRQWGVIPFFLPEFKIAQSGSYEPEPTRGLMSLLMIHDVSPWAIWCNMDVVNEAWAALDEFGYVHAEFIPYFDPRPPATTNMNDVYVSAYRRSDRRSLLIVANLAKEDRTVEVRINGQRLGPQLSGAMSWPDKQPLALTGNRVHVDIPKSGYRMIVVRRK